MMPDLNGIEFITCLRKVHPAEAVPILMVTAAHEKEIRYQSLTAGASDFLTKPIDRYEFDPRVRTMLALRLSHLRMRHYNDDLREAVRRATADMSTEVIADGKHLSPELLDFAFRMKGVEKLCLVTDCNRALDILQQAPGQAAPAVLGQIVLGQSLAVHDEGAGLGRLAIGGEQYPELDREPGRGAGARCGDPFLGREDEIEISVAALVAVVGIGVLGAIGCEPVLKGLEQQGVGVRLGDLARQDAADRGNAADRAGGSRLPEQLAAGGDLSLVGHDSALPMAADQAV